jgi:hypothetical protein
MDCEAHVVSLAFMAQRPDLSVTHEIPLAAPPTRESWFRSGPVACLRSGLAHDPPWRALTLCPHNRSVRRSRRPRP